MKYENLIFFDFDNTLVKTFENIRVWSPRGTRISSDKRSYKPISSADYNKYILADDEYLDENSFIEFNNVNQEKSKILLSTLYLFELFINKKTKIFILSARPQVAENDIINLLKNNSISLKEQQLTYNGCKSSDPEKKFLFIQEQINKNKNIKKIIVFDDSEAVINNLVNNLKHYNHLNYCLFLVEQKDKNINYKSYIK